MFDLVRILFFSAEVADLRRSFKEDYLIDQCVLVARECCKQEDPVGTAISFANLNQFSIRDISESNVSFWVGKAAETHCHDTCERIEKHMRATLSEDGELGSFVIPDHFEEGLKELTNEEINKNLEWGPESGNAKQDDPPVVDPPKVDPPVVEPPKVEPTKVEPTKVEPQVIPPTVPELQPEKDLTPEQLIEEEEAKRLKTEAKMAKATVDLPLTSKQKQALVAGGLNTVREILAYHNEKDLESLAGIGAATRDFILKVISELE